LSDQAVKIHFEATQRERLNEFSAWADKIQVQFRYRLDFLFLFYQGTVLKNKFLAIIFFIFAPQAGEVHSLHPG
jgi:hypothetical protein